MLASPAAAPAQLPGETLREPNADTTGAERINRLMRTEVSFIPNEGFTRRGSAGVEAGEDPQVTAMVELVEQSDELSGPISMKAADQGPGLPPHLARLCQTPLLSHAEERAIFRRMNYCKFMANAMRSRLNRSPELADDAEDYLERAERIRNHLIRANTRLVMSIARRFADARNSFDDLLSQGVASLVRAVEKFDFERGYRFSTYATCAVRRDLYRWVMQRKRDQERFATGTVEHLDACPDEREPFSPGAEAAWRQMSDAIGQMLQELDERERFIVSHRYGLDGSDKKASYSRLGEKLGISKERVRQLANRAMEKLQIAASERRLEAYLS